MNAKIAYYAIPNPTDTASEAPALPRVIPNGVANTNDVIADIKAGIAASEARCRIALDAVIAVALEHVRRGETVDLGGFRLRARIPGSMPCVDTPFDFGENTLVVDVLAEPELNEALAGLVPFKVDANDLASMIKVSNVTDVATMSIGEIHGSDEFIITGNGVTLDATGESAKLTDRKTGAELATAEVASVSKGQRATCKLNPVEGGIAKGQYWLVVTTFGLIGETTPRVFRKPVTLVEAVPAPVPKATLRFYWTATDAKEGGEGLSEVNREDNPYIYLAAAGAEIADGDTFAATLTPYDGSEPLTATVTVERSPATTDDVAYAALPFCEPAYVGIFGTLTLANDSAEGGVELVNKG